MKTKLLVGYFVFKLVGSATQHMCLEMTERPCGITFKSCDFSPSAFVCMTNVELISAPTREAKEPDYIRPGIKK